MKKVRRFRLPEIVFVILLAFSGLMLGFSSGGFVIRFQNVGFTIVSAMQKGLHLVVSAATGTFTAVKDMTTLQKEYRVLTEKLADFEYLQRNNAEIRRENERLKEQLGFASRIQYRNIASQIIGRDPDSLYSGITIDKGSRSGIRKGMPVIAIQNGNVGVVGKIVSVGIGTSKVMPVYDVKCNISSRVQTSRDLGIVSGNGDVDSPLSMKYIKKRSLEELHYGDIVVTSGENDNYMRDIPIGTITKVTVLDYDTSLDIELSPIIDFSRLETVFVVDSSHENTMPKEGGNG